MDLCRKLRIDSAELAVEIVIKSEEEVDAQKNLVGTTVVQATMDMLSENVGGRANKALENFEITKHELSFPKSEISS